MLFTTHPQAIRDAAAATAKAEVEERLERALQDASTLSQQLAGNRRLQDMLSSRAEQQLNEAQVG